MGGHKAGGYASSCAVKTILASIRESEARDPARILTEALCKANAVIAKQAGEDDRFAGMGTTVGAATSDGSELSAANGGDSRLYVGNEGIEPVSYTHLDVYKRQV